MGLISYPLYLYHWLPLSFTFIARGDLGTISTRTYQIIACVFLATLTYLFVEKPIRNSSFKARKVLTWVFMILMLAIIYAGLRVWKMDGMANRRQILDMNNERKQIEYANKVYVNDFFKIVKSYFNTTIVDFSQVAKNNDNYKIFINKNFQNLKPQVLLMGDSHMMQYASRVSVLYETSKVKNVAAFRKPLYDAKNGNIGNFDENEKHIILKMLTVFMQQNQKLETLIISLR